MDRKEFYKEGNKVLTDAEYRVISRAFDDAEQTCDDVEGETSLDDIESVDKLMDIVSEII